MRAAQLSWEHQNVAEPQEFCGSSARQDRVGESTTVFGGARLADIGRHAQRWHDDPQSDGDRDNGSNSGSLSGSDNDNYGGSLSGSDKGSRLRRTTPEAPLRCLLKRTSEINTTARCCTFSFDHHKRKGASVATALAHQHQHVFLSGKKNSATPAKTD